jgi:transcriptional regulator with XRE-family HTH domain
MTGNTGNGAATGFGQQIKKMRESKHWSLRKLAAETGVSLAVLSRVESGVRPPTERVARALDRVFTELPDNWFLVAWQSARTWAPPGFVDWSEYEDKATDLLVWIPGIVDGLAQVEGYARAMLTIHPGATADQVGARLANRMARQRRIFRAEGPDVTMLVDMPALYRGIGSAAIMADQCARLAELAERPGVTVQIVPPTCIPLATALVIVTESAAYTEHALGGAVYTDSESVGRLRRLVGTLRAQARPETETRAILRRAETAWSGVSRPTAATAERPASKRRRGRV